MLESFRDVLSSAMEVYLTVVSNRTNEIVKVLTVFSILLMSVSFLAGVYGMNIELPWQRSPYAFWPDGPRLRRPPPEVRKRHWL